MEDFPDRGAAFDAGREGIFGQLLHHVEDVPVLTLVFVDRHPASILGAHESRLYRLHKLPVKSGSLGRLPGSSSPEPKSCFKCWRAASTSLGSAQISSISRGEALRLTYSSFTTSPRCAPSPRRWMMYSMTLSSRAEG